ncbi:MAG: hypothetical protein U0002_02810 [Thermoanaerobaculia bacterium]
MKLRALFLSLCTLLAVAAVPAAWAAESCPAAALTQAAEPAPPAALNQPQDGFELRACHQECQLSGQSTSPHWGMGSTCSAADTDLRSQISSDALSLAVATCGSLVKYCGVAVVITGSCHSSMGSIIEDGYGELMCKVQVCDPPQA